jgi:hypothetical protein
MYCSSTVLEVHLPSEGATKGFLLILRTLLSGHVQVGNVEKVVF